MYFYILQSYSVEWNLWHILCSWPLFDDHMECWQWSKGKSNIFLSFLASKNVCFELPQVLSAIKNHRIHLTTFFMLMTTIWWPHGVWKVVKCQKYCLFELPDQRNVYFDMPQVYSAIKNHQIHLTTFFMLMTTIWWPLECEKWSNVKNIAFFELPGQKNVCLDMSHVYSAIKNHKIHLTFFMLMTTIWWPLECEKWSNVKNIPFLGLPDQKNVYFDMYICI